MPTPNENDESEMPKGDASWDDPAVYGVVRREGAARGSSLRPVANETEDGERRVTRFGRWAGPFAMAGAALAAVGTLALVGYLVTRPMGAANEDRWGTANGYAMQSVSTVLSSAAQRIGDACKHDDGSPPTVVQVTFAPEGSVSSAVVRGEGASTEVGRCITGRVNELRAAPFSGPPRSLVVLIPPP